ncbi:japanin-like-RA2 isoform X2 [Rhipicephalus microplus]|uniref:japanin-like-RA2 isoform X2 n=1 Tax=Rhipicephalus microplus TaxID=6941 RepID=UPI003F6B355E
MSLCFLHALFTFILMLALSGSKEMVLEPSLCPDLHGPGTFCVNQTLIQMLCKNQSQSKLIEGPINDSDESFDEMTGPSYPLPASENTLYLVGYSRSLNKSEYSCAASVFDNIEGGFIHRTLLLKRAPVPIKYWDERIPLQIQASMCYMTMNLTLSCPLIKIGAKEQYLMFRQTWNYMLLTELIELKKQPLCSIWAKNDFTRKSKVDKYTLAVFYAICKDAVYDGYPKFCPKAEK